MKYIAEIKIMFIPGFLLNFVWESLQSGLYYHHFKGLIEFIAVHLRASLGDVALIFLIYLLGCSIFKDTRWFIYLNKSKVLFILFAGFGIGVTIEKICLQTGRWSYIQAMPIIPIIQVGLSPVLQMTMLPIATFAITKRLLKSR